jgi:hypothetical protein
MYIALVLFYIALLSIIIMVSRKLSLVRGGHDIPVNRGGAIFEFYSIDSVKYHAGRHTKKLGRIMVIVVLRLYVRSSIFLKNKYRVAKIKVKNSFNGNSDSENENTPGKQEASKFLKMISDYKQRISRIKHRIKEEEENNL